MAQTEQAYYDSESNWGGYQYVQAGEVINEILNMQLDDDSLIKNVRRTNLWLYLRRGIRLLTRNVQQNVKIMERTVGPTLQFPVPQNYVDWKCAYVVTSDYQLAVINYNPSINTALGVLQDSSFNLLYDGSGNVLRADASNIYNKDVNTYRILPDSEGTHQGSFIVDPERGVIAFTSELENKNVVIEYVSDGLDTKNLSDGTISIHKNLIEPLVAFVYSEAIQYKNNVPMNEKIRARNYFLKLQHAAKLDRLGFNLTSLNNKIPYLVVNSNTQR